MKPSIKDIQSKYKCSKEVAEKARQGFLNFLNWFDNTKLEIIETETVYRVFTEETEESIPKIVRSLDEIGCKAIRIEATKPSLEDVFFKLTEKKVRELD